MGAGIAKQFKDKFPYLPKVLGEKVKKHGNIPFLVNNVLSIPTKYHWKDKSDIELIKNSLSIIVNLVPPDKSVLMSPPGCGLGGLSFQNIKPLLSNLDDRFTIILKEAS